ncbi:MAG: hypothetical protein WBN75_01740 [Verrucomicrobiia bacterium]
MKISNQSRVGSAGDDVRSRVPALVTSCPAAGFTMVEIAICLAIIGFALVAIIGVLPIGMNTQRDNREETIINQDATEFMEAIRNGAQGMDDLTNYVYAITNYWTQYASDYVPVQTGTNGYTYAGSTLNGAPTSPQFPINNGAAIVGLLSMPEYTEDPSAGGLPIPTLIYGGVSNHVVAYVRSISGPAVEKPPQDNQIVQGDSFGYRIVCANAPVAGPPLIITNAWDKTKFYAPNCAGGPVVSDWYYWCTTPPPGPGVGQAPSLPPSPTAQYWVRGLPYNVAGAILHEVRLTFLWPQLANGGVGPGRQTFRTMVAGQIMQTNTSGQWVYFYQPQSFAN